jgi:carbamoyl-phosphate synthase/aspartate carbamoyltransferase/dihydroorotase
VEPVQWTFEDIDSSGGELNHLADFLARKQFDLVINLPMRNGGARRVSSFMTHGYRTRRLAVDYSVPLITDVKCAKMLVLVSCHHEAGLLNPLPAFIYVIVYQSA